jgi:UDP-N-acetyl-D-mannosaminuronic acid transferase (WecB/TagA/CpsF family)
MNINQIMKHHKTEAPYRLILETWRITKLMLTGNYLVW